MRLTVIDQNDNEHEIETAATGSLMEALRELEYGVAAICGGMCSCATCHVYVAPEWAGQVAEQHSDERDLIAELQHRRETSRLSCQIRLDAGLDGLRVTLAPEE
jgi:2Fe-2S ferredoxin